MTDRIIATGPDTSGNFYAGYWYKRIHQVDQFTPMALCSSLSQAEEAAQQFNAEAAERQRKHCSDVQARGVVHGFYDDGAGQ